MRPETFFSTKAEVRLLNAAAKGDTNTIGQLLKGGVDVDVEGHGGMRPLFWAIVNENFEGFQFLLESGADPNGTVNAMRPPRDTALTLAASLKDPRFLRELLHRRADVNFPLGESRTTVLEIAGHYRRTNNMALLISAGANINRTNANGRTALHTAVQAGNFEVALFLCRNGADPTIKDVFNYSPNDYLQKYGARAYSSSRDKKIYPVLVREMERRP